MRSMSPLLRPLLVAAALLFAPAAAVPPGAEAAAGIVAAANGDRAQALARLDAALRDAPAADAPALQIFLAETYRLAGDDKSAGRLFRTVAKAGGDWARAGEIGQIVLDGADKLGSGAVATLRSVAEDGLPDTLNAERHYLLAAFAARSGQAAAAGEHTRTALRFSASDANFDADLRARFQALAGGTPPPAAEPLDDVAALDAAVAAGDRAAVATLAAALLASAPADSDEAAIARYAERRVAAPTQPGRIGVLLPLSGKLRGVGGQIRQAIELGARSATGPYNLVFADSGETEAQTVAALEKLVLQDGVVGVVGPITTETAEAAGRTAQALRVPLVGLHQGSDVHDDRAWVFDGLATPGAQARALVAHVMGAREMRSFAIFAPDTPYGQSAADAFEAEVKARGGTIAVRVHYDATSNDLIPFAKQLGRKDYTARAAEFRKIRQEIAEKGGDPSRAVLPPVLDFDAIFLPDGHRRIPVAAAGLAYEEFPIGHFKIVKDSHTIPLLGLAGWNHPDLVTAGGPYVRDSLFVDAWLPDTAEARAFTAEYQGETGREPNGLEAQAWTVGRLIGAWAPGASSREVARQRLAEARFPATATGASGIDPTTRRVDHRLRVLTLQPDGIHEVRPPAPPEPPGP